MKAAKNNQGGQADLYKMIESYMNGGKVYENGGPVHGDEDKSEVEVITKDSYGQRGGEQPRQGTDYIIMVNGEATDLGFNEMRDFFQAEGYQDLDAKMEGLFAQASKGGNYDMDSVNREVNKVRADMRSVAEGRPGDVQTVEPGSNVETALGNMLRSAQTGSKASRRLDVDREGRYNPLGNRQPSKLNTDEFLRGLGRRRE
tara:strand:+ start:271 stop:873 length:603 start_codon:yes stop_codon:yes gene_type:complete